MIEEQGVTSRTVSTRSETPSECSTTCGSPLSTAPRPSWRSTKAVWCPRYDMALNAGRGERAKSPGCKSSTQRTSGESCESFGLTPSLANGYLPAAIKTAWRPSSCEGDGDGLGTSWGESRTTSLAQPFTGHLKESARGEDRETPGAELWRQSSRPCILHLEYIRKLAQNPQTWWSFVATLRATQHKGHKWVWVGKHLGNPLRNEALSTGLNLSIDGLNIMVLHLDQIHLLHR